MSNQTVEVKRNEGGGAVISQGGVKIVTTQLQAKTLYQALRIIVKKSSEAGVKYGS